MHLLEEMPGLWFVIATLLPLASFTLLLILGGVRNYCRRYAGKGGAGEGLFQALGGEVSGRGPAYVALLAIFLAFCCSFTGFVIFLQDSHHAGHDAHDHHNDHGEMSQEHQKWKGSVEWAHVSSALNSADKNRASFLKVGFYIDSLSALMFVMVTFIATLIHLFSMGYMGEELHKVVEDHEIHTDHGHFHRRGRFGRFFMFLSLFCFSMLNLILADNLFQVFVSWELVGVCSFLLIGFYYERTSASNAANKAFITNRVGDAGFIIGLLILWTQVGTLNFEDLFGNHASSGMLRCPLDNHGQEIPLGGQILTGNINVDDNGKKKLTVAKPEERGQYAVIFKGHVHPAGKVGSTLTVQDFPGKNGYGYLPYWMLTVAGLGVFLGCVGKSAQFPLQVWLPDAMEGPTPVSALIHAATMVAAGVYLVGRCFALFTPEALVVIAYTGGITMFMAATIAIVMTDIKKVLAYSTVSQLGMMMLALGVGGWVAGLFHLITHAFFKALMFLASGSVIYGCHHQQDMMKMGGLYKKMRITGTTMLIGVLAIAGIPLFSGWYSKDAILASALGFATVNPHHFLLFLLPLMTAGITTFYMFRMWLMTFTGKPRDHHVYEHAHETPWMMTLPLILLGVLSVCVAWGRPIWDPEASALEHLLHHSQPASVVADFGGIEGHEIPPPPFKPAEVSVRHQMHEKHLLAGNLTLGVVIIGLSFALMLYFFKVLDPAEAKEQFPGVYRFLQHKWYFDEFYSAMLVRPALAVAHWARAFDTYVIDGLVNKVGHIALLVSWVHGLFDKHVIDGLVNLSATVSQGVGSWLRGLQTGYLRSYILFMVLAAVGIWAILMLVFGATPAAGGM